jgi:hypothetical protein
MPHYQLTKIIFTMNFSVEIYNNNNNNGVFLYSAFSHNGLNALTQRVRVEGI